MSVVVPVARAQNAQRLPSTATVIAAVCIPLGLALAAIGYLIVYGNEFIAKNISLLVSLLIAAVFALSPLIACFVQTISIDRQSDKLFNVIFPEVKATQYFKLAVANLQSIRPASVTQKDFRAPMLLFATVITLCSLLSFVTLFWSDNLAVKTVLLGGLHTADANVPKDMIDYQSGTLVIAAVAFVGAYLALFKRLLDQLNNNDIYPISFHYYSLWLIGAMIIAAIMRHAAGIFGPWLNDSGALILVGFAIGAAPSPFFASFVHWAFDRFKIAGDKDDPERAAMPSNLNLLMIDGLANDKINRLSELDITDAQVLSCQNPFSLWVRLPYDLALIVDWISQAQLYVCLREDGFRNARAQEVNDIHKFVAVLSNSASAPDLCAELGLKPAYAGPLLRSLDENPCYDRLREVRAAMLGRAPAAAVVGPSTAAPAAAAEAPFVAPAGMAPAAFNPAAVKEGRAQIAAMIVDRFAGAGYPAIQQIAALSVAVVESGLDPAAKSSDEDSWGLFQLSRSNGFARGQSSTGLQDPETNIDLTLAEARRYPDFGAAATMNEALQIFIAKVMRPARTQEIAAKCSDVAKALQAAE